jgi:hypothetical protein
MAVVDTEVVKVVTNGTVTTTVVDTLPGVLFVIASTPLQAAGIRERSRMTAIVNIFFIPITSPDFLCCQYIPGSVKGR